MIVLCDLIPMANGQNNVIAQVHVTVSRYYKLRADITVRYQNYHQGYR